MDRAPGAGTPELEVRLLGPLTVVRGGAPVGLGGQKPRALLAVLALEARRVVSVDALVEALWPGDPPETAAHAVQVYVSQLRKVVGVETLVTRAPGYVLELDADHVDVHRFSRLAQEGGTALAAGQVAAAEVALREALALWWGPALVDFLYEPFAQMQIARLEELRTVVVEQRIDADLALGRHAELVSELEALVRAERLREHPRAQLMLALYRCGRQADALQAYRDARETLVEELGIDPGPELKELEAAILRQDESLLLDGMPLARPTMQFRRLATILYVDVVDSMAVADALDAEALADVQRRYYETVSAALTRHGGTVEKYAGDAVMAVFGIPASHEDDALRAARAALDIRAGVASLNDQLTHDHGITLEIRIGLATGEVVATATESRQRFVAGDAVGVAARLEHEAEPGEILVGGIVARLIDHAATLEPLGVLEVKSRKAPIEMFRLLRVAPVAPAFEQRLDAPLVGRKRELAALRRSLKLAVHDESARIALVVAGPGVGKSRLASELARRTRGITMLWGRCLSYGEGITYWPLREMLEAAPESDERDAALAALEGETSPAAPEIALFFRRFCEALARQRPLLLVFDDIHWGERTLLDLVERLGEQGGGPILVVCLARDELLEEHENFLDGFANVDRIVLDALSGEEAEVLLDGLGGAALESDQRARIAEAAEGNPLFIEQLLALALEGGLGAGAIPETVQALLAARLDRLGPGERALLERAAVVGRRFALDDVVALLEPEALPTAQAHLETLVTRGFVRPEEDGQLRFRHALVQEAVYRAAPKRLRADIHERYADRLDTAWSGLRELDEFAGYHLEQAYRLRAELGESDRRVERLAEDGGRRLGDAGIRALKRGDMPATTNLMERATSMMSDAPLRSRLLAELGIALLAEGQADRARHVLEDAIRTAEAGGDRPAELRARIELAYLEIDTRPGTAADELLALTAESLPVFEATQDDRAAGRTWLYVGFAEGSVRGQSELRLRAAEQALSHYRRCRWPSDTAVGEIVAAMYFGPTDVVTAIERCEQLIVEEPVRAALRANVDEFLAGFIAQRGDFGRARSLLATARAFYADVGQATSVAGCDAMLGDIELLAGDAVAAEYVLLAACHELETLQMTHVLATKASDLAEALWREGRTMEAAGWTRQGELLAAEDDSGAQSLWRSVRGKIVASEGDIAAGEELARRALKIAESTDNLNRRASIHVSLGEIIRLAGRDDEALAVFEEATALYALKGNLAGVEHVARLRAAPLVV